MLGGAPKICEAFFILRPLPDGGAPAVMAAHPIRPPQVLPMYPKAELFCFPEGKDAGKDEAGISHRPAEAFFFMLDETDAEGSGTVGVDAPQVRFYHCYRVLSGDVMCVVSQFPYYHLFSTVLEHISCHGMDTSPIVDMLNSKAFPEPGMSFSGSPRITMYCRPDDAVFPLSDSPVWRLFGLFGIDTTLTLVGLLLQEERVVVVDNGVGNVASVVVSLLALLTPFRWCQPMLAILPHDLIALADNSDPFLLGVHAMDIPSLLLMRTSRFWVADCRSGTVSSSCAVNTNLPGLPHSNKLRDGLKKMWPKVGATSPLPSNPKYSLDSMNLFLDYFVSLYGNYRKFLVADAYDDATINSEALCASHTTAGDFYRSVARTTLFAQFKRDLVQAEQGGLEGLRSNEFTSRSMEKNPELYPHFMEQKQAGVGTKFMSMMGKAKKSLTAQMTGPQTIKGGKVYVDGSGDPAGNNKPRGATGVSGASAKNFMKSITKAVKQAGGVQADPSSPLVLQGLEVHRLPLDILGHFGKYHDLINPCKSGSGGARAGGSAQASPPLARTTSSGLPSSKAPAGLPRSNTGIPTAGSPSPSTASASPAASPSASPSSSQQASGRQNSWNMDKIFT